MMISLSVIAMGLLLATASPSKAGRSRHESQTKDISSARLSKHEKRIRRAERKKRKKRDRQASRDRRLKQAKQARQDKLARRIRRDRRSKNIKHAKHAKHLRHGGASTSTACLPPIIKKRLGQIRDKFGPVTIISTYRPGARIAGTGRRSKHADCRAVDFKVRNLEAAHSWLNKNHKGGLGIYSGSCPHIHIDNGGNYRWRRPCY